MWYLGRSAFLSECEALVVVTAMGGKVGKQLEKQFRDVRCVLCRITIGVRHLYDEFHTISIVEKYLNYFQLRHSCRDSPISIDCLPHLPTQKGVGRSPLESTRGRIINLIISPQHRHVNRWTLFCRYCLPSSHKLSSCFANRSRYAGPVCGKRA